MITTSFVGPAGHALRGDCRWDYAVAAAGVMDLENVRAQRRSPGRVERTGEIEASVSRPGLGVEISRDGDDGRRLRNPLRKKHRQRPAATVSNPDNAIVPGLLQDPAHGRGHAGDHLLSVSGAGPKAARACRRCCEPVVARPTEVDGRRRIELHQPQYERVARCGVIRGPTGDPGHAITVQIDMQGSTRLAALPVDRVRIIGSLHHLAPEPECLGLPVEMFGRARAVDDKQHAKRREAPRARFDSQPAQRPPRTATSRVITHANECIMHHEARSVRAGRALARQRIVPLRGFPERDDKACSRHESRDHRDRPA